jgi:phage gpG-like protein
VVATVRQKNPGWLGKLVRRYQGGPVLAMGWPVGTSGAGTRYPDGTSVVMVASVNQFGATIQHPGGKVGKNQAGPHQIDIPARDFMTPGGKAAQAATEPIKKALLPALNAGKVTKEQILGHMGPFAEAALKKAIADFTDPPNAPSTIRRKGDDNPLEDTRLMVQSVTHVVRAK